MRVGIDARIFKYKDYRGIATTISNIIKEWSCRKTESEYYLISNSEINISFELPDQWHLHVEGNINNGVIWTLFELPTIIKKLKIDVFWGPNFLLPFRRSDCKYLVTVHDLALFKIRGTASKRTYLVLKLLGSGSCKRADKVLAISEATKKDIVEMFGVPPQKVVVMHNGIDPSYIKSITPNKPENITVDEGSYFVVLGTIEPRKNPITILKSYEIYRKKGYGNDKLVFIGAGGWNLREFYRTLKNNEYKDDILFTGYVKESEKKWLLCNSKALLFPSLYEGFGLPVLEAFALGTPVIATNVSAIPEVGGDACVYIDDPKDSIALAEKMFQLKQMKTDDLINLKQRMNKQVLRFTWKRSVDILIGVINNI